MRSEYIKEFLTLCEAKNYSVCAEVLYISQPSLTRHIQELEKELKTPLFKRTARGVELNEAGRIFYPFAQQMEDIEEKYTDAIRRYLERQNGTLNIGSIYAIPEYGITPIIGEWTRKNPEHNIRILENDSSELLKWLRQDLVEYAFAREDFPEENGDLNRITICRDHLVCLVPEGHPLAAKGSVTIPDLKYYNLIYYENCPLLRNLLLGAGIVTESSKFGAKGRNALLLVKQGVGIMLDFRRQIADSELGGFSILEIEPRIESSINFLYHQKDLSPVGKKFVNYIKAFSVQASKEE